MTGKQQLPMSELPPVLLQFAGIGARTAAAKAACDGVHKLAAASPNSTLLRLASSGASETGVSCRKQSDALLTSAVSFTKIDALLTYKVPECPFKSESVTSLIY